MNPNIAFERKPGPITIAGKEISRMNALKSGRYSKILGEVKCCICKKKEQCPYFEQNAKCSLPNNIIERMDIDNIDSVSELINLYKLSIAKGVQSAFFDEKDSVKWFALATRQLEVLNKIYGSEIND